MALEWVVIISSKDIYIDFQIAQYNAWCRNNGDYETSKRGAVNWNQELIWKMRSELDYPWDIIEEDCPQVFEELLQALESMLKQFISKFTGTLKCSSIYPNRV